MKESLRQIFLTYMGSGSGEANVARLWVEGNEQKRQRGRVNAREVTIRFGF